MIRFPKASENLPGVDVERAAYERIDFEILPNLWIGCPVNQLRLVGHFTTKKKQNRPRDWVSDGNRVSDSEWVFPINLFDYQCGQRAG